MTDPTYPIELIEEMKRRTERDGIPRHITPEGKIMKLDWILSPDADLDSDLDDHIRRLTEEL